MRLLLGILLGLLAGCQSQPTVRGPSAAAALDACLVAAANGPAAPVLRIGLEDLPPDERAPQNEPPRAVAQRAIVAHVRSITPGGDDFAEAERPTPRSDYARIDDPVAREALHFVEDLVDADRRRVRHEVGLPFFDVPDDYEGRGPLLSSEIALEEDRQRWLQEHGPTLLRRPVQQLLRRLPVAQQVDVAIENFGDDHLVINDPTDRRRWLRLSLRLHANDPQDPVEVAGILGSLRLASSQEVGKASWRIDLAPRWELELRGRTTYADGSHVLRADLAFRPTPFASYHLAFGDDMDFLTTSSQYSLFETPMDGSPGLVLYATHIF